MSMTPAKLKTRLVGALVLVAALGALAGAPAASAAPAATLKATDKCWLQVVNDWLQHGTVTNFYAIPCYTQAIQHLSAYPDIKQYSSAIDDIQRAQQAAIHEERAGGGPNSSGGPGLGGGGGGRAAAVRAAAARAEAAPVVTRAASSASSRPKSAPATRSPSRFRSSSSAASLCSCF